MIEAFLEKNQQNIIIWNGKLQLFHVFVAKFMKFAQNLIKMDKKLKQIAKKLKQNPGKLKNPATPVSIGWRKLAKKKPAYVSICLVCS